MAHVNTIKESSRKELWDKLKATGVNVVDSRHVNLVNKVIDLAFEQFACTHCAVLGGKVIKTPHFMDGADVYELLGIPLESKLYRVSSDKRIDDVLIEPNDNVLYYGYTTAFYIKN